MPHRKHKQQPIGPGDTLSSGSRQVRLDAVDGKEIEVTITLLKGEGIEIRDPTERDQMWILDDQGEGEMDQVTRRLKIGHKIRIGGHRQFRIMPSGNRLVGVVVGPVSEVG